MPRAAGALGPESQLAVTVQTRELVAENVVALTLAAADRSPLPAWTPGAHIDLRLSAGLVRQYSLCSRPGAGEWRIAVLREAAGRGGSAFVHDELAVGTELIAQGPRNQFELVAADRHIFIAGGIGITPILPMVQQVEESGGSWTLHYGGRSRASMAFASELAATGADQVVLHPQDEVGLIDLADVLGHPAAGTAIYCCGPPPLLDAVSALCADWPAGALHIERFAPQRIDAPALKGNFEVELAASGLTLTVPDGMSILEVVEAAGVPVLYSCREGICGTCETRVLAGEVDHRDSLLTPEERAANDVMFICVSRAGSARLTLDL